MFEAEYKVTGDFFAGRIVKSESDYEFMGSYQINPLHFYTPETLHLIRKEIDVIAEKLNELNRR